MPKWDSYLAPDITNVFIRVYNWTITSSDCITSNSYYKILWYFSDHILGTFLHQPLTSVVLPLFTRFLYGSTMIELLDLTVRFSVLLEVSRKLLGKSWPQPFIKKGRIIGLFPVYDYRYTWRNLKLFVANFRVMASLLSFAETQRIPSFSYQIKQQVN